MSRRKLKPVKVDRGWLYWDFDVRGTRAQEKSGAFTVRLRGNRTGQIVTATDEWPMAALAKALVKLRGFGPRKAEL